jgi:hypothetical protein
MKINSTIILTRIYVDAPDSNKAIKSDVFVVSGTSDKKAVVIPATSKATIRAIARELSIGQKVSPCQTYNLHL